jgi:hypothetical protein
MSPLSQHSFLVLSVVLPREEQSSEEEPQSGEEKVASGNQLQPAEATKVLKQQEWILRQKE